ncbi:hypothetical protein [Synechococcus sp. CC9902]|uniref:hypothetical protein n=1 Tax=Synechococcus sp. (strain CC9902) TaxID=316279 RepID=UPI0012E9ADA7|nr:hypothetical protein [Synechococcus sp. CC9902]
MESHQLLHQHGARDLHTLVCAAACRLGHRASTQTTHQHVSRQPSQGHHRVSPNPEAQFETSSRSGGEGSCQQWFWDERTNRL